MGFQAWPSKPVTGAGQAPSGRWRLARSDPSPHGRLRRTTPDRLRNVESMRAAMKISLKLFASIREAVGTAGTFRRTAGRIDACRSPRQARGRIPGGERARRQPDLRGQPPLRSTWPAANRRRRGSDAAASCRRVWRTASIRDHQEPLDTAAVVAKVACRAPARSSPSRAWSVSSRTRAEPSHTCSTRRIPGSAEERIGKIAVEIAAKWGIATEQVAMSYKSAAWASARRQSSSPSRAAIAARDSRPASTRSTD